MIEGTFSLLVTRYNRGQGFVIIVSVGQRLVTMEVCLRPVKFGHTQQSPGMSVEIVNQTCSSQYYQ